MEAVYIYIYILGIYKSNRVRMVGVRVKLGEWREGIDRCIWLAWWLSLDFDVVGRGGCFVSWNGVREGSREGDTYVTQLQSLEIKEKG